LSQYLTVSKSPLYSFIFTLPLFLLYEVGIFLISSRDIDQLRNGADVLMRQVLESFGIYGMYGFGGTFLIGFLIAFIRQKKNLRTSEIESRFLLIMFFESIVWATLLVIMMIKIPTFLSLSNEDHLIQQVVLAIGAGIYEEFVFRVLLISGLAILFGLIFNWGEFGKTFLSVIISSAIFSIFHFFGSYGDTFSFPLFFVRFFAGIFLAMIYIFRGFGITAYAHSIYDLFVLVYITTND
jgi:membrane protease YdiL (CAAX protease family)